MWEYPTSPLFPEAEKVAIEFAIAAASQPNDVTDELFDRMKQHWDEGQIVEITALISYFGFMNRWNDTMATPLEDKPAAEAQALPLETVAWDFVAEPRRHAEPPRRALSRGSRRTPRPARGSREGRRPGPAPIDDVPAGMAPRPQYANTHT